LLAAQAVFATPSNATISAPVNASGYTFNARPWIVFSATDASHQINDVHIQIANNSGFSPTTADYWSHDSTTYRDSFYPMPAASGANIWHRLYPGGTLGAGTWYVRVAVRCSDGVNRDCPGWSTSVQMLITSPTSGMTETITDGTTLVRLAHFSELKTAIDNLRSFRGSGAYSWDASWATLATGTSIVRIVHLNDLRSALSTPYTNATGTAPSYTAPDPVTAGTPIRGVHIREIRADANYP